MTGWFIRLVARVPASVYTKLLVAFLAIVVCSSWLAPSALAC